MNVFGFAGRNRASSTQWEINPSLGWRPSSFLSLNTGFTVYVNDERSQWIGKDEDRYVFGRIDQRTVAMTARVNYTVTPNLSIQLYAQPFVSAGDYSSFTQLVDGRARDVDQRFAAHAYGSNPDFNYRSFRTTNVLRWEYRPGSTLFVVWQQGEDSLEHGTFRFGRDLGGLFDAPARNVFLVKWAYWLNY